MSDRGSESDLAFLDGVRGLAAFWVLWAHCMIWGGWYGIPLPSAKLAVDLFMILSGYLMTFNATRRESVEPSGKWSTWSAFYVRRFFRIAPAYYVSLFVAVVLADVFLGGYQDLRHANPSAWMYDTIYNPSYIQYTPANILAHLSFIFGLIPEYSFSTMLPDWSLSLEMQFYLVFPLLYLGMRTLGVGRLTLVLVALCVVATHYLELAQGIRGTRGMYPEPSILPMKLPLFLVGMLLAQSNLTPVEDKRRRMALALGALGLIGMQLIYDRAAVVLIGFGALIFLLGDPVTAGKPWTAPLRAMFANKAARFAGDASYCVYLFHGFFIAMLGSYFLSQAWYQALPPSMRVGVLTLGVTAGSYFVAMWLRALVERPGIRLGRHLAKHVGTARRMVAAQPESA